MKRREDGAVREVMKELLRSDLRFHKRMVADLAR